MFCWAQFEREAAEFVERVGGGWEFIRLEPRPGGAYLVCKNNTRRVGAHGPPALQGTRDVADSHEEAFLDGEIVEDTDECVLARAGDDEASAVAGEKTEVHVYDYFVVYSSTYQVPVLYFQASHLDGQMLTWDEVWADVPSSHRDEDIRWNFITQQEHPVTGVPCFHIHPCETKALMSNVSALHDRNAAGGPSGGEAVDEGGHVQLPANYLMSWLSAVGPVVGLHIPLTSWLPTATIP